MKEAIYNQNLYVRCEIYGIGKIIGIAKHGKRRLLCLFGKEYVWREPKQIERLIQLPRCMYDGLAA